MKKGFTFSEAVVAIGIMSVLAVIMIPTIKAINSNSEEVKFKKAYYLAENTIDGIAKNDLYYDPERGFADTDRVFYNNNRQQANGNSKFCNLFAASLLTTGAISCDAAKTLNQGGNFTTKDGMVWSVPIADFSSTNGYPIQVDVNGAKGDNCFAGANCNTPDRFLFYVYQFGNTSYTNEIAMKEEEDDTPVTPPVNPNKDLTPDDDNTGDDGTGNDEQSSGNEQSSGGDDSSSGSDSSGSEQSSGNEQSSGGDDSSSGSDSSGSEQSSGNEQSSGGDDSSSGSDSSSSGEEQSSDDPWYDGMTWGGW